MYSWIKLLNGSFALLVAGMCLYSFRRLYNIDKNLSLLLLVFGLDFVSIASLHFMLGLKVISLPFGPAIGLVQVAIYTVCLTFFVAILIQRKELTLILLLIPLFLIIDVLKAGDVAVLESIEVHTDLTSICYSIIMLSSIVMVLLIPELKREFSIFFAWGLSLLLVTWFITEKPLSKYTWFIPNFIVFLGILFFTAKIQEGEVQNSIKRRLKMLSLIPAAEDIDGERKYELERGKVYAMSNAFDIFLNSVKSGSYGLLISKSKPSELRKRYNLKRTPIVWLTKKGEGAVIAPDETEKLKVLIKTFMEETENSIILLDGLNSIIAEKGKSEAIKFISEIKKAVHLHKSILLVADADEEISSLLATP